MAHSLRLRAVDHVQARRAALEKDAMITLRFLAALPFVFAIVAPACSAPDPAGPARAYAGHSSGSGSGAGSGAGGGGGGAGATGGGGGHGGGSGGGNDYDAGPVPGATDYDSGTPSPGKDAGSAGAGKDAGTGSGTLGSCGNPICGTDLNQCGCRATDSANNTIEIGCQAGGQCGCFQNGNFVQGTANAENGACQSNADVKQRFLSDCLCN